MFPFDKKRYVPLCFSSTILCFILHRYVADDESNSTGLYENEPTKPFYQVSIVQDLTLPYFLLMSVTYTPYV
jgi:hypothetical protein